MNPKNRPRLIPALVLLNVCFYILACHKKDSPVVQPTAGSMKINLTYPVVANPTQGSALQTFELIVSETGGKILLDTLATINIPVNATLQTNETLVDVTTVYKQYQTDTGYTANTYKAVAPSGWTIIPLTVLQVSVPGVGQSSGKIDYFHAPPNLSSIYNGDVVQFSSTAGNYGYSSQYDPGSDHISYSYNPYAGVGHFIYLVFPNLGLYKFHQLTGVADTVDLSHMDTAAKVRFSAPPNYYLSTISLIGFHDTTDLSKSESLYYNSHPIGNADLLYPRSGIQKYLLNTFESDGRSLAYNYSFGDTVSASIFLMDDSYYTVSHSTDNVTVEFKNGTPAFYEIGCTIGKVNYTTWASPGLASLHPLQQLTSLKSKLLSGEPLSAVTFDNLYIQKAPGLDFPSYMKYVGNGATLPSTRLAWLSSLWVPL